MYTLKRYRVRKGVSPGFSSDLPSLVDPSGLAASDINNLVARFLPNLRNGRISMAQLATAAFSDADCMDLSNLPDYQSALDFVIRADEVFSELPASLRKRFSNDPQQLLLFLGDVNNRDEAVKLGLIDLPVDIGVSTVDNNKSTIEPGQGVV